jgi:hypothetical protein
VVARLSDVFQTKLQSGKYFTISYGVYNRGARTLAYCNAAHPAWPAPAASGWGAWGGPCGSWSSRPAPISSELAVIREKADSIIQVATTTTQVASRTDLLSTDAATEAEKAGEHGRGSLVVAREARPLADQTAVATLDIENMVRLTEGAVSAGVLPTHQSGEEVRSGVGRAAEVNGQAGQIIAEVAALGERFGSVNEGMSNQSAGARRINEAMGSARSNARGSRAAR